MAATTRSRTPCSRLARPTVGGRPPIIVGGQGRPRSIRHRRPLGRRVQRHVVGPGRGRRQVPPARRGVPCDRARSGDHRAVGHGGDADRGRSAGARGPGERAAASGSAQAGAPEDPREWLDVRRPKWIMGTFDEARAAVQRYADVGVQRLMLQDMLPWDLDMIRDMGREIVARVRSAVRSRPARRLAPRVTDPARLDVGQFDQALSSRGATPFRARFHRARSIGVDAPCRTGGRARSSRSDSAGVSSSAWSWGPIRPRRQQPDPPERRVPEPRPSDEPFERHRSVSTRVDRPVGRVAEQPRFVGPEVEHSLARSLT